MTALNPTVLTQSTRFVPAGLRSRSQSPSRSPIRKAQFTARELDPLLANLSPDSTLKALQATDTIRGEGQGQDALARSIAEATPAEREIGIRAAVAAQKVKQWHQEIAGWPWPSRRDRGWGAGFLPPPQPAGQMNANENTSYLGFLPVSSVDTYQSRIEDIRDGLEALDLEEVKDHIFNSHVPQRSVSAPYALETSSDVRSTGYGRMRDFTALITATVIQALPELASLTMLLDSWDVRLSVLRQIPEITQIFRTTRSGIQTAFSVVRSPETGPLVTVEECDATKTILGEKVALLGSKIDKLLDMLEGHEDSLPKNWIDTLETVENEYAAWVVEAEHVAIRNSLLAKALSRQPSHDNKEDTDGKQIIVPKESPSAEPKELEHAAPPQMAALRTNDVHQQTADEPSVGTPLAELPPNDFFRRVPLVRKQAPNSNESQHTPLTMAVPKQGHNRGVSEVSLANSTLSAMSDLSSAEIVDAKSTQVLMSPKINVVDNPLRASRDELSWLTSPLVEHKQDTVSRPPMLQRASTASIEMISRNSIKQVNLTRSRSHDMLSAMPPPPSITDTTSGESDQLNRTTTASKTRNAHAQDDSDAARPRNSALLIDTLSPGVSPTPSLLVKPLQIRPRTSSGTELESPALPRRSSKRKSQNFEPGIADYESTEAMRTLDESPSQQPDSRLPTRSDMDDTNNTLDARIKGIVSTMPNKIRLANEDETDDMQQARFAASSRSSTPFPPLVLAPAKAERAHKQNTSTDIRVFHLKKVGQAPDMQPVKLFVRSVGERVMVRVGGGWADLADYLREYNLHHAHRGIANGNYEVVNFPSPPASTTALSAFPMSAASTGTEQMIKGNLPPSASNKRRSMPGAVGKNDLPTLNVAKSRNSARENGSVVSNSNSHSRPSSSYGWKPPPVPAIPVTYTAQSPTMVTTTMNGVTNTSTIQSPNPGSLGNQRAVSAPISISRLPEGRFRMTTTTTSTQFNMDDSCSQSGVTGLKTNEGRAMTPNRPSGSHRESWVDGMVGRARALSNGHTIIHGSTTTTTTTTILKTAPINNSRRMSAFANLSPAKTPTPVTTLTTNNSSGRTEPKIDATSVRSKNRMSFGDVSSIRRVFLRKKSDK